MEAATPEGTQSAGKPIGTNKEKRPGNGAGNGNGVKAEKVTFTKKSDGDGSFFDLLLVSVFCVQVRGKATATEVSDDIETRLNSKVRLNTLSDALEALKKQEILAMSQDGDGNTAYSVKRYKFNCSPAIFAQGVLGTINELRADSTGALIIEKFSNNKVKEAAPRPSHPVDARATFVITRPFLGAQIWDGNLELQENYFEAGRYFTLHLNRHKRMEGAELKDPWNAKLNPAFDADRPLMFERTYDGRIVASHAHSVQNFFRNAVESGRSVGLCKRGFDVTNSMAFSDIIVEPSESQLSLTKSPIFRGNERGPQDKSAPPKYYETLKAGTELVIEFSFPTKNFVTPKEMKFWLERVLYLCIRSMSPARGDQVGTRGVLKKFEICDWEKFDEGWVEVR